MKVTGLCMGEHNAMKDNEAGNGRNVHHALINHAMLAKSLSRVFYYGLLMVMCSIK